MYDKNLYAYCDGNPIVRRDSTGAAWETVFDVVSLGDSILTTIANPYAPLNWVALAGDAIDVAVPFFGGLGEGARALKTVNKINLADAQVVKQGWKVGDNITNLTKAGNTPKWSTVKTRYWKNEAYYHATNYSYDNYLRMKKGLAPQVKGRNGKYYSMELHHKQAKHKGGSNSYKNLEALSPWAHAMRDPYRHFKY